jgi:cell division protein FtsN
MVDGQVGFHKPEQVRRLEIEKNNSVVNALNKTKTITNKTPNDLFEEQKQRLAEIQAELKKQRLEEEKSKKLTELQRKKETEARSYDKIMKTDKMMSNVEREATVDASAARAYEEDFF